MGLLDRFRKKETEIVHDKLTHFKGAVLQSFSHIRRDIDVQKQWIAYLSNIHETLKGAHESHRELSSKEMQNVRDWIRHLDQSTKKHGETMHALEKSLQKAFNQYNQQLLELYKRIESMQKDDQAIRDQIRKDVQELLEEKHRESEKKLEEHGGKVREIREKHGKLEQGVAGVYEKTRELESVHEAHMKALDDMKKEQEQTNQKLTKVLEKQKISEQEIEKRLEGFSVEQPQAEFTKPEQKLLNLLMGEPDPVTYQHIAEKTGNSINTVRVIMNNLKKRGLIEEHVLPSGVKLFNANNKEKIKKFYNIEHL